MDKTCIFCDGRVNSKEDLPPKWIIRLLKKSPKEKVPMRTYRYGQAPRQWMTGDSALRVGKVCKGCNNGWMSRLENDVKPIFSPMILGTSATLTASQQERITTWLTKCTLMYDSMDKGDVFYDVFDRQHFKKTVAPFSDTAAWLGHYSGTMARSFVDHRTLRTKFSSGGSVKTHVLTMCMGQLVLQITSVKRLEGPLTPYTHLQTIGPRLTDALVQVWPWNLQGVPWPPSLSFNDTERHLKFFAYRFGGDKV